MQAREPPWGYFQKLTNIILLVEPRNMAREDDLFRGMGIKVVTGSCYLGGFVGDRAAEDSCISEKVKGWTKSETNLSGVAYKHLHSAYAGLQKSLQQEWEFLQRVTPQHRGRLRNGGTGSAGLLCSSPLPGPGRGNTGERGHTPTCETFGPGPP